MLSSYSFIATPEGILINGILLAKASGSVFSPKTLRYVSRAETLLKQVTPEDWESRTPHTISNVPTLAKINMLLALAPENRFTRTSNVIQYTPFNFVTQLARGRTLLVGEGNLSFAISLARTEQIVPSNLVATTFEPVTEWSLSIQANAKALQQAGVAVLGNVDATHLSATFGIRRFDNIVFQFPHTGSRDAVEGHNSNFILVRDFLISAASQLAPNGQVFISAVDSPHYQGAFQFDEASKIAGFLPPEVYPFDPSAFADYEHIMTLEDTSALDNHDQFSTWVFKRRTL